MFDVNDIVTLRVYGHLIDRGVVPRSAGNVACGLRSLLQQYPDAEEVVLVRASMGSPAWVRADEFDPAATHVSGLDIVSFETWRLKNIRDRIIHDLQAEAETLGAHDGDDA